MYIKTDSARIVHANITKITLTGALDLIQSYQKAKAYTDSLIPAYKVEIGSLKNQLSIHEEKDVQEEASIEEKNIIIKKAEKKAKLKKIGNSILFSTFAIGSAVLMVLYLTK